MSRLNEITKEERSKRMVSQVELVRSLLPQWTKAISYQVEGRNDAAMTTYLDIIDQCPTALSALSAHDNLAGLYILQKEEALSELS